MTTDQRSRRVRLWSSIAVCLGLVVGGAVWMARAPVDRFAAHAQTAEQMAERVAETAADNLRGPEPAPVFELDTSWPKPLPNNWGLGQVWGVAVDARDHVWVVHQTNSPRYMAPIEEAGKDPAPAVLEFDQEGNLLQAWGEAGQGGWTQGAGRAFPAQAINVDWEGNIWVSEETRGNAVVKFSPDGQFLLQIGHVSRTNGSGDTTLLGGPSGLDFYQPTNEVFIADGYRNQRVIVFDAHTGEYKRHWGRFGIAPNDNFEPGDQPTWVPSPFLVGRPPGMGSTTPRLRARRERVAGRPCLCLRPLPQHALRAPDGRHVRRGGEATGAVQLGRLFAGPRAALPLCRRDERDRADFHSAAQRPADARVVQQLRAALHGLRFAGQPVHVRPAHAPAVGAAVVTAEDGKRC